MKKLLFILSVLASFQLQAQQDLTLYNLNFIPQSNYCNPALLPNARLNIGLPVLSSIYFSNSNSGFPYRSLVTQRGDSMIINFGNVVDNLKDNNYILTDLQIDLLNVSFKLGKNFFGLSAIEKVNVQTTYPKDIFGFIWYGNGDEYLGKRISFDGLGIDAMHYREYALTYARELNEKIVVGGRFKYLYGMENVWTKTSQMGITTDATNYDITVDGSLEVLTSGFDSTAFDNFDAKNYLLNRNNTGVAYDLGIVVKPIDKLKISASFTDLGSIKWNDHIANFKQNDISYKFRGIELYDAVTPSNDSAAKAAIEVITDTLKNLVDIQESYDPYSTRLPLRLMAGASWQFFDWLSVGAVWHAQNYDRVTRNSVSLSANVRFRKTLQASVTYSLHNGTYKNLGFGFAANGGPVQFYTVMDNVLFFLPGFTQTYHLRTGINITIGRKPKDE